MLVTAALSCSTHLCIISNTILCCTAAVACAGQGLPAQVRLTSCLLLIWGLVGQNATCMIEQHLALPLHACICPVLQQGGALQLACMQG